MKKLPALNSSATQKLNSDTDFINWDAEQIKSTIAALKSKAEAFNCKLRISSSEITLANRQGDFFSAVFDDYYDIETVEFNMSGSAIRGSLAELDEITEKAAGKLDALNELKQVWREVSQWLELLAYAKANNLNSNYRTPVNSSWGKTLPYSGKFYKSGKQVGKFSYHAGSGSWNIYPDGGNDMHWLSEAEVLDFMKKHGYTFDKPVNSSRRKLNGSVDVDYDYAGEELEDGYFEGSVAGTCTGLSQKYAKAPNWQFNNDVAAYVSTAADIISATQHNDHFEVEISAQDEDEFEDTVSEVIEFIRTEAAR